MYDLKYMAKFAVTYPNREFVQMVSAQISWPYHVAILDKAKKRSRGGFIMKLSITDYEDYLYDHYKSNGIDTSLFMKLVEEVGEVAEVLNKRDGRKVSDSEDLNSKLANELVDVIHYAFAIASLNQIDLNDALLEKDKKAALKYHHERNLEQFLSER